MFEILPHTADVRIRVSSASLEGLFEDAGLAIGELCDITAAPDRDTVRSLEVESGDRAGLLVDFLNELVGLLQVERLSFQAFETIAITETRLVGRARFVEAEGWTEDIKAVTYHDAVVRYENETWQTTIVVDI